jgi:hypothetical protein
VSGGPRRPMLNGLRWWRVRTVSWNGLMRFCGRRRLFLRQPSSTVSWSGRGLYRRLSGSGRCRQAAWGRADYRSSGYSRHRDRPEQPLRRQDTSTAQMNREAYRVARCTVERLMRAQGLCGISREKTRVTTISQGGETERPADLVEPQFVAQGTEPVMGGRSDLHPHPRWMGIGGIHHRRVQSPRGWLASVDLVALQPNVRTPRRD